MCLKIDLLPRGSSQARLLRPKCYSIGQQNPEQSTRNLKFYVFSSYSIRVHVTEFHVKKRECQFYSEFIVNCFCHKINFGSESFLQVNRNFWLELQYSQINLETLSQGNQTKWTPKWLGYHVTLFSLYLFVCPIKYSQR